jgi:glycine/D-amino acid oxidase-like deaminating enzyme
MDDLLVVGGGIMGLATAWAASKKGHAVTLVDARPRINDHNASNDVSKIFRFAYAQEREHVLLAKRALPLWRELERASGRTILRQDGLFLFGPPNGFADQSARTLLEMGEPMEVLEGPRAHERFPVFHGLSRGVVDPHGGWLDPTAALDAFEEQAQEAGARIRRGVGVERVGDGQAILVDGTRLEARHVVVTAGFHAPRLLPHLRGRIRVTRQVELFFRAPPDLPAVPVFAAMEEGFYGFPHKDGLVKLADHAKGPTVMNVEQRPPATAQEEAKARAWLRSRIPALADAPLVSSRVCLYDNTVDDRFILARAPGMPRVVVGAGFSGHGFKFAPAIGEILAAMALE